MKEEGEQQDKEKEGEDDRHKGDDVKDEEEEGKGEAAAALPVEVKEEETDEEEAKKDNLVAVTRKLKRKATRMIDELRSLRRTGIAQNCGLCLACLMLNLYYLQI